MVKGVGGSLVQFVDPVPNHYMGSRNPESLLYDGAKYHCSNTLDPDFKAVKFYDITAYAPFPPSRMPASIELSIKLVVSLSAPCLDDVKHSHRAYSF